MKGETIDTTIPFPNHSNLALQSLSRPIFPLGGFRTTHIYYLNIRSLRLITTLVIVPSRFQSHFSLFSLLSDNLSPEPEGLEDWVGWAYYADFSCCVETRCSETTVYDVSQGYQTCWRLLDTYQNLPNCVASDSSLDLFHAWDCRRWQSLASGNIVHPKRRTLRTSRSIYEPLQQSKSVRLRRSRIDRKMWRWYRQEEWHLKVAMKV